MFQTVMGKILQAVANRHAATAAGRPPLLDVFEHLLKERVYSAAANEGLTRGSVVIATRNIYSEEGAIALKGESGVVFEQATESAGPMVRWDSGGASTIANGDVVTYS